MAIQSECAGCGTLLQVANEHAGKKARCPQCGFIYSVPSGHGAEGSVGSARATEQPAEDAPTSEDQWWVRTEEGDEYGPVGRRTLDDWFAENRISRSSHIRHGQTQDWQPADKLLRHFARRGAAAQRSASRLQTLSARGRIQRQHWQPHRAHSVLAMAIFGWIFCPAFAILALWQARAEFLAIAGGDVDPQGRSTLIAATVLSGIEVFILVSIVFIFLLS